MVKLQENVLDFRYKLEYLDCTPAKEARLERRAKLLQRLARELEDFGYYVHYLELAVIFAYENSESAFEIVVAGMAERTEIISIEWHIETWRYGELFRDIRTILSRKDRKIIIETLGKNLAETLELIDNGWE